MRVLDKTKKYTYHSNTSHGFCDLTILLGDKKDYYDDTFFHEGFLNGKSFMGGALLCKASWQGRIFEHYEELLTM
jgi:hypothetical protein